MSLAAWYSSQYSAWNRTRRLQQPQFLARTDTNTSRVATAMAQVPGATTGSANTDGAGSNPNKDKKASDPLFGPNIGPCSVGPAWTTTASRKKLITDDLTPEVLTSWVEKSKQSSQPTTTLQALVNLKRPTLRLSPLSSVPEDSQSPLEVHHQHLHGLEFEYDCDAPKCGMYVHVVLSNNHPEAAAIPSASNQAEILVFESVTSGGFGKRLTLEEGALLELGRYDHIPESHTSNTPNLHEEPILKSESNTELASSSPSNDPANGNRSNRRRFTQFHFRKRSSNRSVAGPALAVVDADPQTTQDNATKKEKDKEEEEGVRVIIRLAALDEQGTELASPNEQTTFLHIVRLGAKATAESSPEVGEAEDHRPWVVKVVKREATIGPHTFQLHEIYGLTSSANAQSTTSAPNESHTYPPQAAPTTGAEEDDPSSECLLCLSSPREVVLIPCRHLVACKECALNMVEFGAGGNITHTSEPAAPPPATVTGNSGAGEGANDTSNGTPGTTTTGTGGTPTVAPTSPTTAAPVTVAIPPVTAARRKRKAKGWFCPVCRQPYTSLLRISTSAPPPTDKEDIGSLDGTDGQRQQQGGIINGMNNLTLDSTDNAETTEPRGSGILGGAFSRPGFLRGFSGLGGGNRNPSSTPVAAASINNGSGVSTPVAGGVQPLPLDVESQAGLGRAGA
ncbi:hypothetical protein AN958_09774 [Leucoagaricus sp. SymC.cos]|nr:hypothetical protein AN958_09774 [Leucoagaricus sp. SymC.cos]